MKITDIAPQKKANRVSIYIDNDFAVGLSIWQVADYKLKVGQDVSQGLYLELQEAGEFGKLYDRVLAWLSLRLRSAWEIDEYLRRKTANKSLHSSVVAQLNEHNYIDDKRFAESWVSHRRQTKAISKRRLVQELRSKRLADDIIEAVLSRDEVPDDAAAHSLAQKKSRQSRYKDPKKLLAFLIRQGFDYEVSKKTVAAVLESDI